MIVLLASMIFSLGHPEEVSMLNEQDGKEVTVRGYLHPSAQGTWVLTPHPNTPSCCVASSHKRQEQVVLKGDLQIAASEHPVTVKGVLHLSSLDPKFELTAHEILLDEEKKKIPWVTFSLGIFLIGGFFLWKSRKRLTAS
jgi:hypothetical protein